MPCIFASKQTQNYIMKKKIILFCSIVATLMGYSCSSDDNSVIEPEKELNPLVGAWQIETIDFSYIEEESDNVFTPRYKNDFCVAEYVTGYEFKEDGSFTVVVFEDKFRTNSGTRDDGTIIWTWEQDGTNLDLNQANPSYPPYDFSLESSNFEFKEVNGKETITFEATWWLGSTATMTLVKTDAIDINVKPEVLDKGTTERELCGLLDRI